jgi:hypothetical protein
MQVFVFSPLSRTDVCLFRQRVFLQFRLFKSISVHCFCMFLSFISVFLIVTTTRKPNYSLLQMTSHCNRNFGSSGTKEITMQPRQLQPSDFAPVLQYGSGFRGQSFRCRHCTVSLQPFFTFLHYYFIRLVRSVHASSPRKFS